MPIPNPHAFVRITERRTWLPAAVAVVMVALLALQVGRLAWIFLVPAAPARVDTGATTAATTPPPSLPTADVFFRNSMATGGGRNEAAGYRLYGVRRGATGDSAILGRDGAQSSTRAGGEVAPGVVLESVAADHVVLVAGGTRHRLDLPDPSATNPATATATLPAAAAPALPPAAPDATTTEGGYTIKPRDDSPLLRYAGLAPGDVLLSIDGDPIEAGTLADLRKQVAGRPQVRLQYRRDGETRTTTLKAPQ